MAKDHVLTRKDTTTDTVVVVCTFGSAKKATETCERLNRTTWADMSENSKLDELAKVDETVYSAGVSACELEYDVVTVERR